MGFLEEKEVNQRRRLRRGLLTSLGAPAARIGPMPIFKELIGREWHFCIFGGTSREILSRSCRGLRDLDIVVDGTSAKELKRLFGAFLVRSTRFGGLKLRVEHWDIDLWPLASTWAFEDGVLGPPTFENLVKSTFLNIEAIAVLPVLSSRDPWFLASRCQKAFDFAHEFCEKKGTVRWSFKDSGFWHAMSSRVLDVNLERNPFLELNCIRALLLAERMSFQLSSKLARIIFETLSGAAPSGLRAVQEAHYGHVALSIDELNRKLTTISDQLMHDESGTVSVGAYQYSLPLPEFNQHPRVVVPENGTLRN